MADETFCVRSVVVQLSFMTTAYQQSPTYNLNVKKSYQTMINADQVICRGRDPGCHFGVAIRVVPHSP